MASGPIVNSLVSSCDERDRADEPAHRRAPGRGWSSLAGGEGTDSQRGARDNDIVVEGQHFEAIGVTRRGGDLRVFVQQQAIALVDGSVGIEPDLVEEFEPRGFQHSAEYALSFESGDELGIHDNVAEAVFLDYAVDILGRASQLDLAVSRQRARRVERLKVVLTLAKEPAPASGEQLALLGGLSQAPVFFLALPGAEMGHQPGDVSASQEL